MTTTRVQTSEAPTTTTTAMGPTSTTTNTTQAPTTPLRLVGGGTPYEGRLEVYYNGNWGTICDDHWDERDTAVACQSLGFSSNDTDTWCCARFGQGTGLILLDDVYCLGTESDLGQCAHGGWGRHNCGHHEDVSIRCAPKAPLRLVGGENPYEGRLEVYYNGTWGTICDDGWDEKDTAVACQSLGFSSQDAEWMCCANFSEGTGPILLDDVGCLGTEYDIEHCAHGGWGMHNCVHREDVSIRCSPTASLRLVGGENPYEGRLEVYYNGTWGTICDDGWGEKNTAVACQSLGFSSQDAEWMCCANFSEGTGPILLDDVGCLGTEYDIEHCAHGGWGMHNCVHREDVSIRCSPTDGCVDKPCENNGTCVNSVNAYECICEAGFNGTNCTNNIDNCKSDPCQHNGTCHDLVNDYRCYCVTGFNGTNCENSFNFFSKEKRLNFLRCRNEN
ncbi:neurotrypsin-like [Crassostrea virginica]